MTEPENKPPIGNCTKMGSHALRDTSQGYRIRPSSTACTSTMPHAARVRYVIRTTFSNKRSMRVSVSMSHTKPDTNAITEMCLRTKRLYGCSKNFMDSSYRTRV